jgi:glycosyltransferase involved in cell wall biosynthesis
MKKKVLIIFPDEWVAYSPTILNLVDVLALSFSVKVIAVDNGRLNEKLDKSFFHLIRIPPFFSALPGILLTILRKTNLYGFLKFCLLYKCVKKERADVVIGVDSIGLYTAMKVYGKCHFLSLEITKDIFFRLSDTRSIESVIIQAKERLDYLFPDFTGEVFYIPNSPVFEDVDYKAKKGDDGLFHIVFFGNALPSHGIYSSVEAVSKSDNISMVVKAIMPAKVKYNLQKKYASLLSTDRLVLDDSYLKQGEVVEYLRQFDAGFCFYKFNLIRRRDFNYISCPSGKMFNYFAAGLPVIGTDILGLKPVKEFGAGILIKDLASEDIIEAVEHVRENHPAMHVNCIAAAKHYDFHKRSKGFVQFIES